MVRAKTKGEVELRKVLESQLLPLSIEEERRRREVENKKHSETKIKIYIQTNNKNTYIFHFILLKSLI